MPNDTKYPATHVAHWATGPVNCCEEHAKQLVGLGKFMGSHIAVTKRRKERDNE